MLLGAVWVRAGVASSSTATAESGIKYIRRFIRSLLRILPTSSRIVTKRKRLEKASKDPGLPGLGAIYMMLRTRAQGLEEPTSPTTREKLSDKSLEEASGASSVGQTSDKEASSSRFYPLVRPHARADPDFSDGFRRSLLGNPVAGFCINRTNQDHDRRTIEHQCLDTEHNMWRHQLDIHCRPRDVR
jgi:hypothetical protein